MATTEYVREWRELNPERYAKHKRRAVAKARKKRLTMTKEEKDAEREYFRLYRAQRRALAKRCRNELRSLMRIGMDPFNADKSINIWSATDGQVIQIYRDLERKLAHAEQEQRNARKRQRKKRR